MTDMIARYHFAMTAESFVKTRALDTNGCTVRVANPSVNNIINRVKRIKWGWIKKDIYKPEILAKRLDSGKPKLFDLYDRNAKGEVNRIGYSLVMQPPEHNEFTEHLRGKVVEIENLALFPGNEGGGRGWKYFTHVIDDAFNDASYGADTIYWSVSSTNHGKLKQYYERMGMHYLGEDMVPDFNKNPLPEEFVDAKASKVVNLPGAVRRRASEMMRAMDCPKSARA
jgi:hypothetical protein